MSTQLTDRQALDKAIAEHTRTGYRVVSQSESGVQFARPKQWSTLGLILFVLLPVLSTFLFGLGSLIIAFIGLLIVALDYALRKEKLVYLTADQARQKYS
jgi:hypothetical protein